MPLLSDNDLTANLVSSRSTGRGGFSLRHAATSLMPMLEWLPAYPVKEFLVQDLAGGLTLGCILMGQSLAHADLCKVNLINGPYSCMLPPILYSVFGTSIHASIGTGGLVSLLTGEQLVQYGPDIDYRTHAGAILSLLVGVIMFMMGVCRLAFLVRFLSRPALSGFITASALLIILSQVSPMLGLPPWAQKGGIVSIVLHHIANLAYTTPATLCLSVLSLGFLTNAKRLKKCHSLKFISDFKELILLSVTAIFCRSWNAQHTEQMDKIMVVGAMPTGLPAFAFPVVTADDVRLAQELLPGAVLVALVVFLSSFAGAKKFAMQDGYQIKPFNELVGLGVANAVGACNGAVPTQVGLSRMGIAHQCGVQSQVGANILVAVVVAAITASLSGYLYNVPKCALNCIIVNGASHLTEFEEAKMLLALAKNPKYNWKCRMDIVVWVTGFAATLYFGAFKGILITVAISLVLVLYQVVNPEITALGYKGSMHDDDGRPRKWVNNQSSDALVEDGILVFRLEGPLFYANVEHMQEWLEEQEVMHTEMTGEAYKGIILSAGAISFMDTTAVRALEDMIKTYTGRNILFFVANTFGQTGRLLADNIETLEKTALKDKALKAKVGESSSIDDFVKIIKENAKSKSLRKSLIPRGCTLSGIRSLSSGAAENIVNRRSSV